MSFFESADATEMVRQQRPAEPEWHRVPAEFLPTILPTTELLAIGHDVALVASMFEVYPTGFLFTVRAARHPEAASFDHDLSGDMNGFSSPDSPNRFRLGLRYPDGRRTTNDWPPMGSPRGEAPEASLRSMGGGGSADGVEARFFAWPIPAEGDLDIVYAWPVRGIAEGRFTLLGDALRTAAAAAVPIWPSAAQVGTTPPVR